MGRLDDKESLRKKENSVGHTRRGKNDRKEGLYGISNQMGIKEWIERQRLDHSFSESEGELRSWSKGVLQEGDQVMDREILPLLLSCLFYVLESPRNENVLPLIACHDWLSHWRRIIESGKGSKSDSVSKDSNSSLTYQTERSGCMRRHHHDCPVSWSPSLICRLPDLLR